MSDLSLEPLFVSRPKYSSCLYMTKTQEVFRLLQKRKVFRKNNFAADRGGFALGSQASCTYANGEEESCLSRLLWLGKRDSDRSVQAD
jgi:hypothetical protein